MTKMRFFANPTKIYIFKLSLPILLSNFAIPLVGIIDTALMGNLENEKFIIATSISTSVITLIFWSFGFLRMGTTGLVSQSLGKSDYREIVAITIRNISIALIISIILIIFQKPIIYLVNYFFNISIETKILIDQYISVRILSAPAELVLYVFTGLYIGLQKTKISSILIILFSLLNILLSCYFVLVLNLDIFGVALGTMIASYIIVIIFSFYTYNFYIKRFKVIPRFTSIWNKKKYHKLFNINLNLFIRTILLTFSFLWMTYLGSTIGEDFVAVNTILMQFIMIAAFFLDSYAFSTESIVGFAIGRKSEKSFMNVVKNSFELSFFTSLVISILFIFSAKFVINSFTGLEFIRYLSYEFVIWVVLIPPIASFCYQFDGIFIGASLTKELRNAMIISVALFIFISIHLVETLNNHGLWLSLLLFMIIRSLTLNLFFFKILKKF